ncbi:hypothetical protein [Pseudogemmobacter bohemicus]|uniref:hypothetical protein n=1 Tax=Pseudogemmobacter bohemicus TaxID=2250708 RepID=UPI0013006DC6|nr:hypothetical protein [Pseudogemmobacter bohemicus]
MGQFFTVDHLDPRDLVCLIHAQDDIAPRRGKLLITDLEVVGFAESERFALNRLAWLLPKLVQMEASPKKLPPILGKPTLPTPEDMELLRRVTRLLNPEG